MGNLLGLPAFAIIESLLRIFTYIAGITVMYKLIRVMNTYIDRNSK